MKKILALLLCLMFPAGLWGAQASLPYELSNGTAADGGEVDSDFDEIYSKYNAHDTATTNMHGMGASTLVGTDLTQTLTLKSLTSPTITGTPTATGSTWTSLGTVTTSSHTFINIDGGTIDGVTIGASAAPTVTNLGTVTTCDINGGTIDGTIIGGAATAAISGTTGSFSGAVSGTTGSFSGALTGTTLNTGNGAYELYSMDQNVTTATKPSFAGVTLTDTSSIATTKGFYFDGGSNTYIVEGSADNINVFTGGTNSLLIAADRISIPALARIYLDGNSNTYISEGSADTILFTGGGTSICTFSSSATALQLAAGTGSDVVYNSGTGALMYVSSSKKYKEHTVPAESMLSNVLKLKVSRYDRIDGSSKNELGLIAEEVYPLFPEIVPLKNGEPDSVSYSRLSVILLKAIQEQQVKIDSLEKRIEKLEQKVGN